ncbi:MAG: potassium channel family protein [Lautropia sp.]
MPRTRRPLALIGLAGVADGENERARRWQRRLHWPMLITALIALGVAYLSIIARDPFMLRYEGAISLALAAIFAAEVVGFAAVVDQPRRYLRENWLLVLVALGMAMGVFLQNDQNWIAVVRFLRVAVTLAVALQVAGGLTGVSPKSAPILILIGAVVLVACGAAFYAVDPAIASLGDGLWLSFVTATTVGYGDIVPSTTLGRLFAVLTVLLGASMMALFTATITARFLGDEEARQRREMHAEMKQLHREIASLRQAIHAMQRDAGSKG